MQTQEIAVPVSIVSEHELMIGGILFRQKKEMIQISMDSDDVKTELVHTRFIGDEDYLKVIQTLKNGKMELIIKIEDSNCSRENMAWGPMKAIENFKNRWENKWHPFFTSSSTDTDEAQGSTGMANKIKKFFGLN